MPNLGGDKWQVLYSDGPPTDGIRLGQLLVDEAEVAPLDMLKVCTALSPVTYESLSDAIEADLLASNNTWTGTNQYDGAVTLKGGATVLATSGTSSLILGDSSSAADAQLRLNTAAAQIRDVRYETGGTLRWLLRCTSGAESGSNAGSELHILARQDDGTASYTLLEATRATAQIGLVGGVGSAVTPNWAFISDLNTGIYRPAADSLGISTGGTARLEIQSDGAWDLAGDTGTSGQVLVSGGASAAPTWEDVTGSTSIRAVILLTTVSITSNTTFADIGELVISNVAVGQYAFEAYFDLTAHATPDMKRRIHFTGTAADDAWVQSTQGAASASGLIEGFDIESTLTVTGEYGVIQTGAFTVSVAGDLSFQAAQVTSSATAISVNKGSWLRIMKLA